MDEALDKILVPGRPHHPRVDGPVVEINFVGVPSTKFLLDGTVPATNFYLRKYIKQKLFLLHCLVWFNKKTPTSSLKWDS